MKKKSTVNKSARLRKVKALTNKSGDVRELKREDIRAMKPANEVLPAKLLGVLPKRKRGERGPQKEPKKVAVTLRYSPEVVSYFKKTGQGWQVRMDDVLKKYIKKHSKNIRKNEESQKHLKHQKHSRKVA